MNHSNLPRISVLMPVYNAERYVAEAIESILKQTFSDFEFIIIDDGSTDNSNQILQYYASQDQRIRLFSRENRGLVSTLNEMIGMARGPLLARMDADDISYPDRFAKQVEFLETHQGVACLSGSFELIDGKGRLLTRLFLPEGDDEIQKMNLAGHTSLCHPCAMIRSKAVIDVGCYDPAYPYAEDLDLWLRLGEVGSLANLQDCILKYRLHNISVSESRGEEQQRDTRLACERAWKRRGIIGHFEAIEHWRPGPSRVSQHSFMLRYGWWAFNSGQRKTAFFYGLKSIRLLPLQKTGWILLIVSLVKFLRK